MRKRIALLLTLAAVVYLSGCGEAKEEPAETVIETILETTVPETVAKTEPDAKAIAASLIDHPVEELYEAIGYPKSSEYASSCLKQDADDGNLYYEGFIVYTIRQGDIETVYYVE